MSEQLHKLWRWARGWPQGIQIGILVIALVGGRYFWVYSQRPPHEGEITAAYGSVRLLYGLPQSNRDGTKLIFVGTSDKGYGLFLVETATGQKKILQEEHSLGNNGDYCDLHTWPWSPDGSSLVYSAAGQISICDPTGAVITKVNVPTFIVGLTWLTHSAFACVDANGALYEFEKLADGIWSRKAPVFTLDGFSLRNTGGIADSSVNESNAEKAFDLNINAGWSSGNKATPAWLQYHFAGPAWSITRYKLVCSTNSANFDPRDWQVLGSDDGENWTVLDNRSNETFIVRGQTKAYDFANEMPYRFYRLKITATRGGNGVRVAKFQLWSEDTENQASASAENAPTFSASAAFDGAVDTKWWNDNASPAGWLQYKFGGGVAWAVSLYSLTSGDNYPTRDPMDWKLQASDDGNSWVDLDTRTGETFQNRLQTKSYSLLNTTPYRIYRLKISANQGGPGQGVQLSKLDLQKPIADASGKVIAVSISRNVLAGAFSLSAVSSNTIAYGQGNSILSMSLNSYNPVLILNLRTVVADNLTLQSFSYSQQNNEYLLNCLQNGKGVLFRFSPNNASAGLRPIAIRFPVHDAIWMLVSNYDGWIGNGNRFLWFQQNTASNPVRLLRGANIDAFSLSSDGQQLFMFGTCSNEPSSGIWQYNLAASQLRSVVPYADYPSSYAARRTQGIGSIRLSSGDNVNYEIFRPAHFDRLLRQKYPLVIGDTYFGNVVNGGHGRLWVPAIAACGAYVVIVDRRDWTNGIEQWGEDVMAVYRQLLDNYPNIDKGRVYLFGVSAETRYLSDFVSESPGLWKGVMLLNPTSLPDFSDSPVNQPRPRLLLNAGSDEHEEGRFEQYQVDAFKSGVLVDYIIAPDQAHHFVGNAAQLQRTKAMVHFIFEE